MAVRRCGARAREISDAPRVLVHVPIFATIVSLQMSNDAPLEKSSHPMANGSVTDTVPPQPRHVEDLDEKIAKRRAMIAESFKKSDAFRVDVLRKYIKAKNVPDLIPGSEDLQKELRDDHAYQSELDALELHEEAVIDACAKIHVLFGRKASLDMIQRNPDFLYEVADLRRAGQEMANAMSSVMRMRRNALKKIEKRTTEETTVDTPPAKKAKTSPACPPMDIVNRKRQGASKKIEKRTPEPVPAPEAPAPDSSTMMADMRKLSMPAMMQKYGVEATRLITATKAYANA